MRHFSLDRTGAMERCVRPEAIMRPEEAGSFGSAMPRRPGQGHVAWWRLCRPLGPSGVCRLPEASVSPAALRNGWDYVTEVGCPGTADTTAVLRLPFPWTLTVETLVPTPRPSPHLGPLSGGGGVCVAPLRDSWAPNASDPSVLARAGLCHERPI